MLHADDFGMNEAVNQGIVQGFSQGLLTSTAILALARFSMMRLAAKAPCRSSRAAKRITMESPDVVRRGRLATGANITIPALS